LSPALAWGAADAVDVFDAAADAAADAENRVFSNIPFERSLE
jgi:hypothetical protein